MKTRLVALIALACIGGFVLAGCSTQARAERKGKEAGDQICKAKHSDNANAAERHIRRANDKFNDLVRFTGHDVREDIRDLNRNLNQLARGNGHQQDVNAIVSAVEDARHSARGNTLAAYDGLLEGLAECS